MSKKFFHVHVGIRGMLAVKPQDFERSYGDLFVDQRGKHIPATTLRGVLERMLECGQEVIVSQGCDNYDPKLGCQGHDLLEAE